jgi:5-methylcytosine-specific restriction endonuclease McrA
MKISKKTRQYVYDKYNGKCAYCGVDLVKGWHVDHINPQVYGGGNEIENLNPSCTHCNIYKSSRDLEFYRNALKKLLNTKHEYLFKSKTKMQVAIKMGAVQLNEWDGLFYFEKTSRKEAAK